MSTKNKNISPLLLIFLTVLIDMIGFGIVIPILPLYAKSFHVGATVIGLLLAVYSFCQFFFAPLLGHLSDRFGRKPLLLFSILGTAIGFMVLGYANTLALLFLGRIIDGISGGNISITQAYIADVTPPEKRSRSMGIVGAAFGFGFMLGPAIGGLLTNYFSLQAPFLFSAGLAILNLILIMLFLPESLPAEKRHATTATARLSFLQTIRGAQGTPLMQVMGCALFTTIAFGMVTALYPLFTARRFSWDARDNGFLFAWIGFIGVMIQGGMLGRMLKKSGEKPLLLFGIVVLFLSMVLLPHSGTTTLLIVASSGLAIGSSFVTPILNGLASKMSDPKSQGSVMGVMQSLASLGRLIGPAIGGLLLNYDFHHPEHPYGISLFWVGAAIMVVSLLIALQLRNEKTHQAHSVAGSDKLEQPVVS